jgi:CobQ-like glutamine amidotransferase family enzyme
LGSDVVEFEWAAQKQRPQSTHSGFENLGGGVYFGTEEIFGKVFMTTANTTRKDVMSIDDESVRQRMR